MSALTLQFTRQLVTNSRRVRPFVNKMPRRCVVYGCRESACAEKSVSVHIIPYFGDERPIAVSRRKRWTDFVEKTRKNWKATKTSAVCSKHFRTDDYEQCLASPSLLPGFQGFLSKSLRRDEHGTCSYPTIHPPKKMKTLEVGSSSAGPSSRPSDRSHRQVRIMRSFYIFYCPFRCRNSYSVYSHSLWVANSFSESHTF